jgi:tetratricopeptide (TPR) repeat protein
LHLQLDYKTGYDALEMPYGVAVQPEIGYEKPQSGPTTNFVGNHMTQGAIDLVQAQLSQEDRAHRLLKAQQYDAMYTKPKLMASSANAALSTPECTSTSIVPVSRIWTPVQQFRWTDKGGYIQIKVPPPTNKATKGCTISFSAQPRQVRVEMSWSCHGVGGHSVDWVFGINQTFAEIDVNRCMCVQASQTEDVVIRLHKTEGSPEWLQLEAPASLVCLTGHGGSTTVAEEAERLAKLRKAIRQQRQNKKPLDGKLYDVEVMERPLAETPLVSTAPDTEDGASQAQVIEACERAREYAKNGDYAQAATGYTWAIVRLEVCDDGATKAGCLLELGQCQQELGDLSGALTSFNIALEASARSSWSKEQRIELLIKRASLGEQMEHFEQAVRDYREVCRLDQASRIGLLGTARVQKSLQLGTKVRTEEERLSGQDGELAGRRPLPKSVPRPSMPAFRNRGKSGKPF